MADLIVTAVVLNSIDYKEKDKLVKLFTAETGVISAVLKGVKSANSKLKFACQPFCFAEFELVKKGEFYTITQVNLLDTFFDITCDYDKFLVGEIMLKLCSNYLKQNFDAKELFFGLLNLLKSLVYENTDRKIVLLKFFLEILAFAGYESDFDFCTNCNDKLISPIFFDRNTGALVCRNCSELDCIEFSKEQFAVYKILNNTDIEKIKSLKLKPVIVDNLLLLLKRVVENLLSVNISSL